MKKQNSSYPKSVRILCLALAALTSLGVISTILYILFA